MKLPTVKIAHRDGFCVINEADFDPKRHKIYQAAKPAKKRPTKKKASDGADG